MDGLAYLAIKGRLGLVQPTTPGETTEEQREFVGAEPIVANLARPQPGGWVQPEQLSVWTKADDLDEYEDASDDMKIVLSAATTRRLEEVGDTGGRGGGR